MRKTLLLIPLLLATLSAMAQRSEGSTAVSLVGRRLVGTLPRLTKNSAIDGTVVLSIKVDQYGNVIEAIPGEEGTTINNDSVLNATRSAALKAHFNQDTQAPAIQMGTITYSFVSTGKEETDEKSLKFMGIPVDGRKSEMIASLKEKGFEQDSYEEFLTGVFNGENVKVFISSNHDVVDRVKVAYPDCSDAGAARVKFNNLMSRFDHNAKYVSLGHRVEISTDENIALNTWGDSKYYDVIYFYLTPETNQDQWKKDFNEAYKKRYTKPIKSLCYDEMEEVLFCLPMKIRSTISGVVWFSMERAYYINIYYDNLQNRPRGEDL